MDQIKTKIVDRMFDEFGSLYSGKTDSRSENLRFFKTPRTELEEKTQLIELQRKEIEYYNNKQPSRSN